MKESDHYIRQLQKIRELYPQMPPHLVNLDVSYVRSLEYEENDHILALAQRQVNETCRGLEEELLDRKRKEAGLREVGVAGQEARDRRGSRRR